MIASAPAPLRLLLAASLVTLALAACGRRGALEPPPDPAAIALQKQKGEQRRQRTGNSAVAPATDGVTAGQTRIPPIGQTNRIEGENPPPDDDENDLPSMLASPLPTAAPGVGRKRGYVVPKEPFILDPLL